MNRQNVKYLYIHAMQDRWQAKIDEVSSLFEKTFGSLTEAELNWKPHPSVWSIAQNIDHLMVINKTYFPVIRQIRNGSYRLPFHARFGWLVSSFGKIVLKAVHPDRRKKMKTFPIWEPAQGNLPGNVVNQFLLHQIELKALIQSCQDLVKNDTVIFSPANRTIVYKLETAFDIIVTHERRHFEQAKELFRLLPKKA